MTHDVDKREEAIVDALDAVCADMRLVVTAPVLLVAILVDATADGPVGEAGYTGGDMVVDDIQHAAVCDRLVPLESSGERWYEQKSRHEHVAIRPANLKPQRFE